MTFLISMVPVLELRGAIPIGVAHGLDYRAAIAVSIVGNLVPVPFIVNCLISFRLSWGIW